MTNRTSIIALLAAAMTFAVEGANTITVNASVDSHIGSVTVKAKVTSGTQTLGTVRSGERASWDAWGIGTAYTAEVENVSIGYTAKWKVSTNDVVAMTGGTNNTIELSSTAFSGCELSFYGEPIEYAVTLDRQSGSGGASSVRATYDAAMPPATMPTRTGYTFGGYWTEENGGGTQYYNADGSSTRAWDIDEARTLYAKWTANTYTVTLDPQSGSGGSPSVEATFDAAMPSAAMPTRDGYMFGGYYASPNGGGTQYYNADGTSARTWNIGEARTLYAKWMEAAFTVTLDPQGGSGGTESVTATYGRALPPITKPTRGGYKFNGYYEEVNGGGTQYYTSSGASLANSAFTSNTTIYAYWTQNPTVTFELNGGAFKSGSVWTTTTNYEEGVGLTLPAGSELTYPNHAFDGWYEYGVVDRVSSIGPSATGDKVFYAKWDEDYYWVTFDANDGSNHSGEQKLPMANTAWLKPVSELFSREGYGFTAWNTVANGSGEPYVDHAEISTSNSLTNVPYARVTLYAQWTPNPYEVAFQPNGADGGETMANQPFTYDVTQELDHVAFTYTGHAFKGWSTVTNKPSKVYLDGEGVANLATGGVVNLYANWTGVVYTVSFNANGGTGAMDPITCTYNVPTNLPPCSFERDGWGFKEWTNSLAPGVPFADGARVTNLTSRVEDVQLYACWTGSTYSVVLDAGTDVRGYGVMTNGVGDFVSVLTNDYVVGDTWILPSPTNANVHLDFAGWEYEDAQGTAHPAPAEVPPPSAGITNLMATWSWVPDDLAIAVDAPGLEFYTFGTWGAQGLSTESRTAAEWSDCICDGTNAVQSGTLPRAPGDGMKHVSWLILKTSGRGVLTFWWKCAAAARDQFEEQDEFGTDIVIKTGEAFHFGRYDGEGGGFVDLTTELEGVAEWQQVVYTNTNDGPVTFAWKFQYDSSNESQNGGGTGWVDRVTWTPEGGGNQEPPDPVVTQEVWTVTFDPNGGAGEMAAQTFTNGVEQALSPNAFTRAGYTFGGWATNEAGDVVYTDGQSVAIATNTTLYASWVANTYVVAFDANGGEGEMAVLTNTYDLVSSLTSNAFTKSGCAFAGWATNETGAVEYADGAEVLNLTDVAGGTVTLYAQWTEEILPPGPDPEPVGEITFVESVVVADEVSNTNVVVRVSGGHAEKASSVKVYLTYNTAAAADLDLAHGSVGSVATALKFPLTLNWAAGEVGEKVITIPVKADALVEGEEFFTLQLAAASGMELGEARICTVRIEDAQWPDGMSEADAQERVPPGATATTVKTVVDGVTNTVITGYFTKKNSKGNVTAKAMPGYVFVAWVYTKGGKTYSTKATITDKLRKSKKVQPKFAVARYVRALADPANGGKVTGSGKYAHGKTVTLKATPTKYWSFEGWYEISEGATVNNEEVGNGWRLRSKSRSWKVKATNDVTYVATFKPYPKVKLTVDKEFPGGTVKGAGSYLTGKKVTLKATPKKGYAFTGWWRVVVDAEGVCTTNRVSLSASYAYTVKADGVALIARFKKESALVKPTLTWGDYVVGGSAPDVHSTNLTVGVSYSAKLTVAGESVVSITKVTGLPKGLTYKSGKVSGVPTVKKVYTAKVTVALKSNAKKTWTYSVKLNVAALPGWAVGTFKGTLYDGEGEGAAAKGTVTMAVGKTGKISGKFVNTKKKSYAFSAASFKTYGDDGVLWTKAAMKYGSKSVALEIAVGSVERTGEDSSTIVVGIAEVRAAAAPFNGESAQLAK